MRGEEGGPPCSICLRLTGRLEKEGEISGDLFLNSKSTETNP